MVEDTMVAEKVKDKAQQNTQVQPTDCPKHEFRLATVGANDKGDKLTYVFFCVHCLYRTVITDAITQKQGG